MMQTVIDTAISAMTWATVMLNLGFALLVGALLTRWQTTKATSDWSRLRHRSLRRTIFFSIGTMLAAMIAVLIAETATMADVPLRETLPAIPSVLLSTHFGQAWIAGAGFIVLVALSQLMGTITPLRYLIGAIGLIGFATTRSLVSHAVAAGAVSWPVAIETTHLLLISVWLGEVIVAGMIMLSAACGPHRDDRRDCSRYLAQLSTSATFALIGIVATGVINAWRGLGSPVHLLDDMWGMILLTKLIGVVVAVLLGALNRWRIMPKLLLHLQSSSLVAVSDQRRFVSVLRIEMIVLMAVLFAAAVLSQSAPPALS